jgi:protein required for attachment to host cells
MTVARLAKNDWLLVADGARALVLRNDGTAAAPQFVTERAYAIDNPPTRDQGSDKPGRTNDAFGRKSAMETPDWHRIAEDRFMEQLSTDLEADRRAGRFERLIIAAPPAALGALRGALSDALRQTIVAEFNKDWTRMPVPEIGRAVAKVLAA